MIVDGLRFKALIFLILFFAKWRKMKTFAAVVLRLCSFSTANILLVPLYTFGMLWMVWKHAYEPFAFTMRIGRKVIHILISFPIAWKEASNIHDKFAWFLSVDISFITHSRVHLFCCWVFFFCFWISIRTTLQNTEFRLASSFELLNPETWMSTKNFLLNLFCFQ